MRKVKSILQDDLETCALCGRPAKEIHHVMHGTANRKISDKWGLVVGLCCDCHYQVHHKRGVDLSLILFAQHKFENKFGHETWMDEFGKNYL